MTNEQRAFSIALSNFIKKALDDGLLADHALEILEAQVNAEKILKASRERFECTY